MAQTARKRRRFPPMPKSDEPAVRHVARPRVEIAAGLAWFALWTPARGESRAAEALGRAAVPTYTPLLATEVLRRGKRLPVTRPAVGRYLFVGMNPDSPNFGAVRSALGEDAPRIVDDVFSYTHWKTGNRITVDVRQPDPPEPLARLLRVGDVPLRVPVEALQRLEDGLSLFGQSGEGKAMFAAGSRVKAIEGPFASFMGVVEHSDDERVRALLDMFGRKTLVEFFPSQLEAA